MMNDREEFQKRAKNAGGGTNIKLEPGQNIYGVFVGDPKMYWLDFDETTKQAVEYNQPFGDASERFKWNFAVKDGDNWEMKIFSGPIGFGSQVWENIERYGQDTLFEIKREGAGFKTRWHIFYVKDQVTKKDLETIGEIDIFDLKKYLKEPDQMDTKQMKEVPPPSDEDAPF